MALCQRPRAQIVKLFLIFIYSIFGRKMLQKSPNCQGPAQYHPVRADYLKQIARFTHILRVRALDWLIEITSLAAHSFELSMQVQF